jgi:hypothetical protein
MAFNDSLRANESVLFDGEVANIASLTKIKQGTGTVTNLRCLFRWGDQSFAAEKGDLASVMEQKIGFATKISVQNKNGETVNLQAVNMKGLKSSLYALAGMPVDEAALKQPELSAVKNTMAWVAAFGPFLSAFIVGFILIAMGFDVDHVSVFGAIKIMLFYKLPLIYLFIRLDHFSLQRQGYSPTALGIVSPEKFPVYLFSRAKAFGHGKGYAITWCVLFAMDLIALFL